MKKIILMSCLANLCYGEINKDWKDHIANNELDFHKSLYDSYMDYFDNDKAGEVGFTDADKENFQGFLVKFNYKCHDYSIFLQKIDESLGNNLSATRNTFKIITSPVNFIDGFAYVDEVYTTDASDIYLPYFIQESVTYMFGRAIEAITYDSNHFLRHDFTPLQIALDRAARSSDDKTALYADSGDLAFRTYYKNKISEGLSGRLNRQPIFIDPNKRDYGQLATVTDELRSEIRNSNLDQTYKDKILASLAGLKNGDPVLRDVVELNVNGNIQYKIIDPKGDPNDPKNIDTTTPAAPNKWPYAGLDEVSVVDTFEEFILFMYCELMKDPNWINHNQTYTVYNDNSSTGKEHNLKVDISGNDIKTDFNKRKRMFNNVKGIPEYIKHVFKDGDKSFLANWVNIDGKRKKTFKVYNNSRKNNGQEVDVAYNQIDPTIHYVEDKVKNPEIIDKFTLDMSNPDDYATYNSALMLLIAQLHGFGLGDSDLRVQELSYTYEFLKDYKLQHRTYEGITVPGPVKERPRTEYEPLDVSYDKNIPTEMDLWLS